MIRRSLYLLFLFNFLLSNQDINTKPHNLNHKIDKNKYSSLFKQARALEKNGLFDEAQLIYENILSEDHSNKVAFNKIKTILKNQKKFTLLKQIAEQYESSQTNNPIAKIDLLEVYLISNDEKWKILSDEIFNDNIGKDFLIKILLNKLLEVDFIDYAHALIDLKRKTKNKEDFYSLEVGNYYITRLNYEKAIAEYLIFLDKNSNQYNKVSDKIIAIPDYLDSKKTINEILQNSSLTMAKILLSDLAFKNKNFNESYYLLKNNTKNPEQLLDFAYQNRKIKNYDLAIEVYQYLIDKDYNSKITTLAILDMGTALESKSIKSKFDFPISQYFYNNQILRSPYHYVDNSDLATLNKAISLYDSLYIVSKGSDAGFKLAGIKFSILNDLDEAFNIYKDCIKYSKNNSMKFNSMLKTIDIMIAKGDLSKAKMILNKNINLYKKTNQANILAIKNIQIDFFNMEESIIDSISNVALRIPKSNELYNDLLDIQSLILAFKDNPEMLAKIAKIQFLIFQNKRMQAINELVDIYNSSDNNIVIKDFIIFQLSYLFLLNNNPNQALDYLENISHETIFSEFSYILKAEAFDFMLNDKKNAVNLYLDFLKKYPLSIFYDDIRLRLRDLAS